MDSPECTGNALLHDILTWYGQQPIDSEGQPTREYWKAKDQYLVREIGRKGQSGARQFLFTFWELSTAWTAYRQIHGWYADVPKNVSKEEWRMCSLRWFVPEHLMGQRKGQHGQYGGHYKGQYQYSGQQYGQYKGQHR